MSSLTDNVAARKKARQTGTPIVNARPVEPPAPPTPAPMASAPVAPPAPKKKTSTYKGTDIPTTEPNPNPTYDPDGTIHTGPADAPDVARAKRIQAEQRNDPSYNPDLDVNADKFVSQKTQSVTTHDLDSVKEMKDAGLITDAQYESSIQAFAQGAKGVDPFGFDKEGKGTVDIQGRPVPSPAPQPTESTGETITRAQELLQNVEKRKQARLGAKTTGTQSDGTVPETPSTTSETTSQATGQPPPDSNAPTVPPDPAMVGFLATIANLPPEAQFLAPYLKDYAAQVQQSLTENAEMTADMLESNEETYGGIKDMLSDIQKGYKESSQAIQGLLQDARDQNDDFIAKQKKAEEERLLWEASKERRTISKQKADKHDAMVAKIALAGGFGQDAGIREVMESDAEFDSRMSELEQVVSFSRTDLNAKYTGMYLENKNNYINGTIKNIESLQSSIERIGMQQIGNAQAKHTAEQNLLTKAWENQTSLRQDLAKQNLSVAGMIQDEMNLQRDDKRAQEKEALSTMQWAVQTYGDTAPQSLIDNLQKKLPGVDVAGYFATPTLGQVKDTLTMDAKNEKAMADKLTSSLIDMRIDGEEDPLGLWAARALGRRTTRQRIDEAPMMQDLLESGNADVLKEQILITANNSFDSATRKELDSITEANIDIDLIQEKLKGFDNKYGGIFKEAVEGGKKFIKERDAAWFDLKADIGSQMAETRKKFAGVAVTETELAQLQTFMIDFKFDTVGEMGIKLKNAKENLLIAEQSKFDRILGNGAFKALTGRGVDVSSADADLDSWDDDAMRSNLPSQGGNGSGNTLRTSFVTGTITSYGSKYWKNGLDVASQPGSDFKTPIAGTVVKVVNDYKRGYPNNSAEGKRQNGGFGNQVVIRYGDGVKLQVSHLSSAKVAVGTQVKPGTSIGVIGNTGNTYGPTGIHFDITGYKPDGSLMTPQEVKTWMERNSSLTA